MRLSSIVSLAGQYIILGIFAAVTAAVLFGAGYFLLYKRVMKGKKRIRPAQAALWAVFLCYLTVVLGAVMFSRGQGWQSNIQLQLFYSYRQAWYQFEAAQWRNIILNILLFVPMGFFLPALFKKLRVFWRVYLTGFAVSLLIETAQLLLNRGIFEADDLLNNLLGTMIGYGLYQIFLLCRSAYADRKEAACEEQAGDEGRILRSENFVQAVDGTEKSEDKDSGGTKKGAKTAHALLCQIPLLITAGAFCAVFMMYHFQDLGNLDSHYISRAPVSQMEIRCEAALSEESGNMPVYEVNVWDKEETHQAALDLFEQFGEGIDETRTDYYDETAIYYSESGHYCVWIDYIGGGMWFTDFSQSFDESGEKLANNAGADREAVENALASAGVKLPEGTEFENVGDGSYRFLADQIRDDEVMYDGSLTCTYTAEGKISAFTNGIMECKKHSDFDVRSEKEAYEQITEGKFQYFADRNVSDRAESEKTVLRILGVKTGYSIDSKGFYQPVYLFDAEIDGDEEFNEYNNVITIEAIA